MIFDLNNTRNITPEIDDKFTVKIGDQTFELITKEDPYNDCSGCAFYNHCKDVDYNKTPFVCSSGERPDNLNVIFVW